MLVVLPGPAPGMGTGNRFCAGKFSTACGEAAAWELLRHRSVTLLLPLLKLGDTMGFNLGLALYPSVMGFPFPNFPWKITEGVEECCGIWHKEKSASLHSDKAQKNREKQNCLYLTRWKREELKPQISCINYEALPAVPSQNPKIHEWVEQ